MRYFEDGQQTSYSSVGHTRYREMGAFQQLQQRALNYMGSIMLHSVGLRTCSLSSPGSYETCYRNSSNNNPALLEYVETL